MVPEVFKLTFLVILLNMRPAVIHFSASSHALNSCSLESLSFMIENKDESCKKKPNSRRRGSHSKLVGEKIKKWQQNTYETVNMSSQ